MTVRVILAFMSANDKARFPVTLWPAVPLTPVEVERWPLLVEGGRLIWGTGALDAGELPDEWVLRQLTDVNLDDDAAVEALLRDYGVIAWPYFDPGQVPIDRRNRLGYSPSPEEQMTDWWMERSDASLEDARWWLKTARALAGVWSAASLGTDPAEPWAAEGFHALDTPNACWGRFVIALDVGLRPFRARAEYRWALRGGGEIAFNRPRVGLYSAACRQVFNLLVAGETARRCENATCRHPFVHQLGGALQGQHRTIGLKYCTPECARAETQRQYRRRKARLKEQER